MGLEAVTIILFFQQSSAHHLVLPAAKKTQYSSGTCGVEGMCVRVSCSDCERALVHVETYNGSAHAHVHVYVCVLRDKEKSCAQEAHHSTALQVDMVVMCGGAGGRGGGGHGAAN
jgi:hypothetical protein